MDLDIENMVGRAGRREDDRKIWMERRGQGELDGVKVEGRAGWREDGGESWMKRR